MPDDLAFPYAVHNSLQILQPPQRTHTPNFSAVGQSVAELCSD